MGEDTIVEFRQPGSIEEDPLTEVLRAGARQLQASRRSPHRPPAIEGKISPPPWICG